MNRQIRILAVGLAVLFAALFVQVNYLQVFAAGRLNSHPGNNRAIVRDFSAPRGVIQTADGVLIARSIETKGEFERLRQYPEGQLYAHLTGFFSFTFGAEGLERQYNDALAGRSQQSVFGGLSDLLVTRERRGDITLTISDAVQRAAASALGERRGAVVAIDPRDGAVLAMVDFPSYDPNLLSGHDQAAVQQAWQDLNADPSKPLLPRTYRERYFPGSSFKVVTAAVALATSSATPTQPVFPVLRELPLPQTNQTLQNFGGSACGGTVADALRVSCNTVFAQLGLDMGAAKLSAGAAAFGFRQVPPIDLPFGASSVFPIAAAFAQDLPALAKSAIGQQDVSATPLEMALVAAAIANNGVIMTPHLMAEVRDAEGAVVERYQPRPWLQAVPPGPARAVRDMMVTAVQSGTGTRAQIAGVQVGGKTGTAQTGLNTSHVWFVGFAPASAPQVAVAVVLEDIPNSQDPTGGTLAAPIARAVMQAALQRAS